MLQKNTEENFFNEAVTYEAGKSFGEMALIENRPRPDTIKCLEDCHFAVMLKSDF